MTLWKNLRCLLFRRMKVFIITKTLNLKEKKLGETRIFEKLEIKDDDILEKPKMLVVQKDEGFYNH